MNCFLNTQPDSCEAFRRSLYDGAIYLLPPNSASQELVQHVVRAIVEELGTDYRLAHSNFDKSDYFATAVENDSEIFDFEAWTAEGQEKRIGWQNKDTGRTAGYPRLLTPTSALSGERLQVIAEAGSLLIFSGQHLHQTGQNTTGRTRFSIDFRTVDVRDQAAGQTAVNVDNRSTGSSLVQFIRSVDCQS